MIGTRLRKPSRLIHISKMRTFILYPVVIGLCHGPIFAGEFDPEKNIQDEIQHHLGGIKRSMEQLDEARATLQASILDLEKQAASEQAVSKVATVPEFKLGHSIFLMNVDGSGLRPVAPMPKLSGQGSPAWSHDGKRIAFDAWGGNDDLAAHIFVSDIGGGEVKDLGPGGMPNWSPDDQLISFQQYGNKWGVWVMRPDGSDQRQLVQRAIGPQWSPDGAQLAMIQVGNGEGVGVYDVATKEVKVIVPISKLGFNHGIGWSPDGKRLCGRQRREDGQFDLATIETGQQSGHIRVLFRGLIASQVKWSPNGRWVLFTMRTEQLPKHQLYIIDADGNAAPRLLAGQDPRRNNVDPAWSPDSRWIAFASTPGDYRE